MSNQQRQTRNFEPSKNGDSPQNELEIYSEAIRPQSEDEFLERTNLGLGNYGKDEYWQQVESFKNGLYARAAFSELVYKRAVKQTIYSMGREAWDQLPETASEAVVDCRECGHSTVFKNLTEENYCPESDCESQIANGDWEPASKDNCDRRRFIINRGTQRWNAVDNEADSDESAMRRRQDLLQQHAGISDRWTPPQMRMMMMRHEASRSKGARLVDNLFGRVKVHKQGDNGGSTSLLSSGSSGSEPR